MSNYPFYVTLEVTRLNVEKNLLNTVDASYLKCNNIVSLTTSDRFSTRNKGRIVEPIFKQMFHEIGHRVFEIHPSSYPPPHLFLRFEADNYLTRSSIKGDCESGVPNKENKYKSSPRFEAATHERAANVPAVADLPISCPSGAVVLRHPLSLSPHSKSTYLH